MESMAYRIERDIGTYLITQGYTSAAEIGFGGKTVTAEMLINAGIPVICTDIHAYPNCNVPSIVDDCVEPSLERYTGCDLIYAVRPGIEIVPALISLASEINADLIVYHLGDEVYLDGGERIPAGNIILHRYFKKRHPNSTD